MVTHHITKRQRQIARGIALGATAAEVARHLGLRVHTIHNVISDLYLETGTCSQAGLAGWCVVHGVVTLAELQEVYGHGGVQPRSER